MVTTPRLLLVSILLALVAVPAGAQSLAEASEAAKKIKHEWPASTNIAQPTPPVPAAGATAIVPPPIADASSSTKATEAAPKGSDPKNEVYWRGRLRPLTTQRAKDAATVAPLQARYDELHVKFATMNTVFQQQLVAPEMFKVQTELKTATDLFMSDEQAIDDLKEEGRKAGALPGWFR